LSDTDLPPATLASGQQFIAVQASPEFQELRSRLRRFVFPMTAVFLLWYFAYVLLGAFAHDFMATKVWGNINVGILIGLGHSVLAMSGEETMAQVYREIEHPKLKNLEKAGFVIFVYSLIFTAGVSFFAVMIVPDDLRATFFDNPIGGLTMYLTGPLAVRLIFRGFVAIVGTLMLAGAVNTSIVGSNGVLNRVSEDGILPHWFRHPHRGFGTSHRILNLVVALQVATIVLSRGDIFLLGEAYAFGVIWSFFLKALSVLVLRFQRHDQEYKTPGNIRIAGKEIPYGLILTTLVLFFVALANLFSKRIATISGVSFTAVLFIIFTISEHRSRRKKSKTDNLEQFNLDMRPEISTDSIHVRPGCVLVAVRDYSRMQHLQTVLQKTNIRKQDIVVMTVRSLSTAGTGEYLLSQDQVFTDYERELFSRVVSLAEKEGKPVELLTVPGVNPFDAMVHAAATLRASRLVTGVSARMDSEDLARRIGLAWEKLPEPKHPFSLEIITPDRPSTFVNLGPHPPRLWPEDIDLVHLLWLELSDKYAGSKLHHRDIVGVALRRLQEQLQSERHKEVVEDILEEIENRKEPALTTRDTAPPKSR